MNELPADRLVVLEMAGHRAVVASNGDIEQHKLQDLGFERQGDHWIRDLNGLEDRLAIARQLITLRALFSGGAGWSPAELLAMYREKGEMNAPYEVITWRNKTEFEIAAC